MEQRHSPLLVVEQLNISINDAPKVQNLSFTLHAGECLCLLGASGSGKSLTAAALLGTLPTHASVSGSIRLLGKQLAGVHLQQRGTLPLAAIFQNPFSALNPLVTIGHQLIMVLRYQRALSREDANRCASDMLQMLGLPPQQILTRYPGQLSGGQCQRICVAIALASQPALLIADEPTTALDTVSQRQLLDMLRQFSQQPGAPAQLFITHDLSVAAGLCQRALVLAQGRLVESGSLKALIQQPKHHYTQQLVAAAYPQRRTNSLPLQQVS
ncbi:ATP-binding cassette domain-containing protein [Serratia sp. NPDC078593]|uniref:ATP-binding cassette domain-containing protein n=1 Tax=unclassified Serratia (in: enterobacteria) TaxID=2647522 RepID=UPI0037D38514